MDQSRNKDPGRQVHHLLVVDGDDEARQLLASVLAEAEYVVNAVDGGTDALAALASQRFDLALVDVTRPELDAPRAIDHIRRRYPGTRVVVLTAKPPEDAAVEARMLGAADFLNKPFELQELLSNVGLLLGVSARGSGQP
jgi:DNA-binding response OmpR family regulator